MTYSLPPEKDPIGLAVSEFFETRKNQKIEVSSNLTEGEHIDSQYLFRSYLDMPKLEQDALRLCHGTTLDVGAAAGCHSIILQERGIDVHALEISSLCCQTMQARGIKHTINDDYFNFSGQKFDTILMLMNGIGIAKSLDGLKVFLDHSRKLLADKGMIIFDSSDIQYLFEEEDGSIWYDLNSKYYGEMSYEIKFKKACTGKFDWLFIDFDTLHAFANQHGYEAELLMEGKHYDYLAKLYLP